MASALRDWLPSVIQSVDPWMSESDIDIGSRWGPDLDKELEKAHFGVLCLTPESMSSTWIHYEAGALSKFVDKAHVCPYLLDLQPNDIKGPLVNFQAARANKDDTLKLVQTISHAAGDRVLSDKRVHAIFEKFWPDLETVLASIHLGAREVAEPSRSQKDMIEEILKTVREQSRIISEVQTTSPEKGTVEEILKKVHEQSRIIPEVLEPIIQDAMINQFRNFWASSKSDAIPINLVYNDGFMKKYTSFDSYDDFMDAARELECSLTDAKAIEFIAENTSFPTWEVMRAAAVGEWIIKRNGFNFIVT